MSGPRGTLEVGNASELAGTHQFLSAPTTPSPVLKEKIPHQFRAVSIDREQGPRDNEEIREEVMRVETRAINQDTAPGLTSLVAPGGGRRILYALLAENSACREPAKPRDGLHQETEQTPAEDNTTSLSGHSDTWAEEIASAFSGLNADGTSFEKSGFAGRGFVDNCDVS